MAEVAAKQLYRIRESRLNLVTGEVDELPADGESFKLIIQQLDEQEAAPHGIVHGDNANRDNRQTFRLYPR